MRTIKSSELKSVLEEMASYLDGCAPEEMATYFQEIANTGLFHDAVGNVVEESDEAIVVSIDY